MSTNNTSEFIFDEVLETGFTVVPNSLLIDERLSDGAIGLYCRIVRSRNINGWKVYQSALTTPKNGKTKVANAMKELIEAGWITKEQLRNSKGHLNGVRYTIYSKSQIKIETHESIENTNIQPKPDFPTSVEQTSVNESLKNKDNKNKDNKNKDNNSSSSKEKMIEEEDKENFELEKIMRLCQLEEFKLKRKDAESLLLVYSFSKISKAIVTATSVNKDIKNTKGYLVAILNDMDQQKVTNLNINKKESKSKFNDFGNARNYDDEYYENLEKRLLGGK